MTKENLLTNSLEVRVKRIRIAQLQGRIIPRQTVEMMKKYQLRISSHG